jgi:type IV pilus assembly protein PilM
MFSFAKKFFGSQANPIGVDFGSDCLKMAQIEWVNGEPQLIAAAAAEVPGHVRHNQSARLTFFAEAARDLLSTGGFKGRQAILALPAASMYIQHLRLAKMDDELLKKALPWEARGKLPIDPSHALMRHLVAGEIYHDSEPKNEIILMAAARQTVTDLLAAASKAKLDVIGMGVEPSAMVDCFGHIYRRAEDRTSVSCYVDIGCASSRAVIAQGARILFARSIKVGGEHLNRAVATALKMNVDDAKLLRIKLCYQQTTVEDPHRRKDVESAEEQPASSGRVNPNSKFRSAGGDDDQPANEFAVAVAAPAKKEGARLPSDPVEQHNLVMTALAEPLSQLASELDLCRRYYETTFPNKPVDRLIFVGGEAKHRAICQFLAGEMGLHAQVGDPLVRMGRTTKVGIDSGMDRRQAQPGWAVSIGLSLGPTADSTAAVETK